MVTIQIWPMQWGAMVLAGLILLAGLGGIIRVLSERRRARIRQETNRLRKRVTEVAAGRLYEFNAHGRGGLICPICEQFTKTYKKVYESEKAEQQAKEQGADTLQASYHWHCHCNRDTCGYEWVMKSRLATKCGCG